MHESSVEEVVGAVDEAVEELLNQAGWDQPPIDTVRLAQRHLGMAVCLDRRQPQRGRAQRAGGGRLIYLRPEPTEERRQWTVAHEIGEHVRPLILRRLGATPAEYSGGAGESLANLFAYRLLAPARWFVHDAPSLRYDLPVLKQRYRTASHEVIAWRMLDLPDPCVITVVDNNHVTRRRSNAWRITRMLTPTEQKCQQYVNYYSRPRCVQEQGWTVTGWPVHQPDWKREILRSVGEE